jgi:ketosteroid isomerase-like protein
MRTIHNIAFCALVATSWPAFADDAADVRAANDRWTVAMKAKDMAAVESIVGPEFVLTRGQASGADERMERPARIGNLKQMSFDVYRADVTDVQVTGAFAVAKVDGYWTVTQNGRTRSGPFGLYDIWFKRSDGWQVIRRHQWTAPTPTLPARP